MSTVSLTDIHNRFVKEALWLQDEFHVCLNAVSNSENPKAPRRLSGEMAIVRLHDCWARFCRELLVLSAGGRPLTATGIRLPLAPGISSCSEVMPKIKSFKQWTRKDPRWADPSELLAVAQELKIANFTTIAGAIGSVDSPIEELRIVRNFYAHRCLDTVQKVRSHRSFSSTKAITIEEIAGELVESGVTRMENWTIELRLIAGAAIQ